MTNDHTPSTILDVMGAKTEILLCADDTGGACSVVRITTPPHWENPRHIHWFEDEIFYSLEGETQVTVGDKTVTIDAGQSAFGPKRIPHSFANKSDRPAIVLITATPGDIDRFFRAVAETFPHGSEIDGRIVELIERHGMSPA
ncbi:MAG: hypothetical protein Phyf2KO_03420 [Phycisphaerales bacterium]